MSVGDDKFIQCLFQIDELTTAATVSQPLVIPPKPLLSPCVSKRNPAAYLFVNTTGKCHPLCNVNNLFDDR